MFNLQNRLLTPVFALSTVLPVAAGAAPARVGRIGADSDKTNSDLECANRLAGHGSTHRAVNKVISVVSQRKRGEHSNRALRIVGAINARPGKERDVEEFLSYRGGGSLILFACRGKVAPLAPQHGGS